MYGAVWTTPEAKHYVPAADRAVQEHQYTKQLPFRVATVLESVCALLDRTVREAPGHGLNEHMVAPIFHSVYVPAISASDYLMVYLIRLGMVKKEALIDDVVLYALCLIDRLLQMQSHHGLQLCENNMHRILLVAMVLASKMLDDDTYNNSYWAQVGGVTLDHLNALEHHMTQLLDFRLVASARAVDTIRERLLFFC